MISELHPPKRQKEGIVGEGLKSSQKKLKCFTGVE